MEDEPLSNRSLSERLIFDESDRGAALVGAAHLEGLLVKILYAYLGSDNHTRKNASEPLLDSMGPLGSFSEKIRLCYALGFITREQFEDIEIIRKLRNEFTHSTDPVDFTDKRIVTRMEELEYSSYLRDRIKRYSLVDPKTGKHLYPPEHEMHQRGYIKYGKSLFAFAVEFLVNDLQDMLTQVCNHRHENGKEG